MNHWTNLTKDMLALLAKYDRDRILMYLW